MSWVNFGSICYGDREWPGVLSTWKWTNFRGWYFFSRVRTPCGHGAQVIVEGREEQSDGGEKNKDTQHNPNTTTQSPQAESPPSCSLSSVLGETGETKTSDEQWA